MNSSRNDTLSQQFKNLDQSELVSITELNKFLNPIDSEDRKKRFENLKSDPAKKILYNLAKQVSEHNLLRANLTKEYFSLSANAQQLFWLDYLKDDAALEGKGDVLKEDDNALDPSNAYDLFENFIKLIKNPSERIDITSQLMKLMQFKTGRRLIDRITRYAGEKGIFIEIIPERITNEGFGAYLDRDSGNIKLIAPLTPSSYLSSKYCLRICYAQNDNEAILAFRPLFLIFFHELTHVKRDLKGTSRGEIDDEVDLLLWHNLEEYWTIVGSKYSSERVFCQEVGLPQRVGHIAFEITINENKALNMLNFWHNYDSLKVSIELAGGEHPNYSGRSKILDLQKDSSMIDYCLNCNLEEVQTEIKKLEVPQYFPPKNKKI